MNKRNSIHCLAVSVLLAGCVTSADYSAAVEALDAGDFPAAETVVDEVLQKVQGRALEPSEWDYSVGDTVLLAMEKAMLRLAAGDPRAAIRLLAPTRDVLDERRIDSLAEFLCLDGVNSIHSVVRGGQSDKFRAAEYEHLMTFVLLGLCDLLTDRRDQIPYANQFDQVQQQLESSNYGVDDFDPGKAYRRLALGNYLEGLIRESYGNPDLARASYVEAANIQPDSPLIGQALARLDGAVEEAGAGVVHVFYFAGRGPSLGSSKYDLSKSDPLIETVVRLLIAGLDLLRGGEEYEWTDAVLTQLTQLPIPVPYVEHLDSDILEIEISAPDVGVAVRTEEMMNVHRLAELRMESMRTMLLTRALLRRAIKYYFASDQLGGLLGSLANMMVQTLEDTDTRCWRTLPAEVQVARLVLPAGVHEVHIGSSGAVPVEVCTSQNSFLLVLHRDLASAPIILVDELSEVPRGEIVSP